MVDEPYPGPDWQHWLARGLWRLDQAVALSLGIDPWSVDGNWARLPPIDSRELLASIGIDVPQDHVPGGLLRGRLFQDEYFMRFGIAQSCAGMSLPVREGRPGGELVEPAQFIPWARTKGFQLAPELEAAFAGNASTESGSEHWGELGATTGDVVERLARWIFAKRPLHHFGKLLDAALKDADLCSSVGKFVKAQLRAAYQLVYETQPHAPPVTGWELREPFKSWAEKEAKHSK